MIQNDKSKLIENMLTFLTTTNITKYLTCDRIKITRWPSVLRHIYNVFAHKRVPISIVREALRGPDMFVIIANQIYKLTYDVRSIKIYNSNNKKSTELGWSTTWLYPTTTTTTPHLLCLPVQVVFWMGPRPTISNSSPYNQFRFVNLITVVASEKKIVRILLRHPYTPPQPHT